MTKDQETRLLIKKFRESKSEKALTKIFKIHRGFIYNTMKRFGGVDDDMNEQNMKIGIFEAVNEFDLESEVNFISYAVYKMMGANAKYNRRTANEEYDDINIGLHYYDNDDKDFPDYRNIKQDDVCNKILLNKIQKFLKSKSKSNDKYKAFSMILDPEYCASYREMNALFNKSYNWIYINKEAVLREIRQEFNQLRREYAIN